MAVDTAEVSLRGHSDAIGQERFEGNASSPGAQSEQRGPPLGNSQEHLLAQNGLASGEEGLAQPSQVPDEDLVSGGRESPPAAVEGLSEE